MNQSTMKRPFEPKQHALCRKVTKLCVSTQGKRARFILCRLTEGLSTKHILPSAENAAHLTIPWLPQMKMIKGQHHPVFWLNCNDDS
jgi:hypothetical protein